MQFDAAVGAVQRQAGRSQVLQREDGVLQRGQQAGAWRGLEVVVVDDAIAAGIHQRGQLGLGLLAPGGQQAVAGLQVLGLAGGGQACQPARVDHVEPVFGARVQRVDVQIGPARQLVHQGQVHRRDGGQAKHMGRRRQARLLQPDAGARVVAHLGQRGSQAVGGGGVDRRAVGGGGDLGLQPAPQRGLPGFVVGRAGQRAAACRPGGQPVGPVGDVLVDLGGHALRQVEPGDGIGLGQVARQPRVAGHPGGIVEGGQHPPGQPRRLPGRLGAVGGAHRQRRAGRGGGQRHRALGPQPGRQEAEAHVGADAEPLRHLQRDGTGHRLAGHHHLGCGEQVAAGLAERGGQQVGQGLLPVGEVQGEHARRIVVAGWRRRACGRPAGRRGVSPCGGGAAWPRRPGRPATVPTWPARARPRSR